MASAQPHPTTVVTRSDNSAGPSGAARVDAFEAAQAEGKGVVTVDGRMIENLHVDNARRILALHEAISERAD